MISKWCSIDKGAFIMLKRFLPSTLSHYNGYFELRRPFTMMSPSLPISSAKDLRCFSGTWCEIACENVAVSWKIGLPLSLSACEPMSGGISIPNLSEIFLAVSPCIFHPNSGFLWRTGSSFLPPKEGYTFFMWLLLTESMIQQNPWNITIVTYNAFQLWTKHSPLCHNIKG